MLQNIYSIYICALLQGFSAIHLAYLFRENRIFAILSVIIRKFSILNALFYRLYQSFFLFR